MFNKALRKHISYFLFLTCNNNFDKNICYDFFSEASRKGHHGGLLALNSSRILSLSSFTLTCPQGYTSFPRCMVCNQPTTQQLTPQSQGDAVWRQSNELSSSPFLQITEKWQGILAEQKYNVICGQSVIGLDPNYSTNYHEISQDS